MQAAIFGAIGYFNRHLSEEFEQSLLESEIYLDFENPMNPGKSKSKKANALVNGALKRLETQNPIHELLVDVRCLIFEGFFLSKLNPILRVSGENLEEFRRYVLSHCSNITTNQAPWPPTKQTISKRLGGGTWNKAMDTLGFPTVGRGPETYSHKYSGADYSQALLEFMFYCDDFEVNPSMGNYDLWSKNTLHPNIQQMRTHFMTWSKAMEVAKREIRIFRRGD